MWEGTQVEMGGVVRKNTPAVEDSEGVLQLIKIAVYFSLRMNGRGRGNTSNRLCLKEYAAVGTDEHPYRARESGSPVARPGTPRNNWKTEAVKKLKRGHGQPGSAGWQGVLAETS